jgi:hypothetical protein
MVNACLKRLDGLVGAADRRTLVTELVDWYADFVVTGLRTGGKTVWRFTPRMQRGETVDKYLVQKAPARFRTRQYDVAFTGDVFGPDKILSRQGFWIVGPADSRVQTRAR